MTRSQSGNTVGQSAAANTVTCTPLTASLRAATRPSAPLLPGPATTTTRRPYEPPNMRNAAHATAEPARSINTFAGVLRVAVASMSRISSGVTIDNMSLSVASTHPHHRRGRCAYSAITYAMASRSLCVNETCHRVTPASRASSAARADTRNDGAPESMRVTDTS